MHKIAQKVTSVALAASMLLSMFAVNTVAFADEFKDNTTVSDEVTEAPVSDDEVDAVESVDKTDTSNSESEDTPVESPEPSQTVTDVVDLTHDSTADTVKDDTANSEDVVYTEPDTSEDVIATPETAEPFIGIQAVTPDYGDKISAEVGDTVTLDALLNRDDVSVTYQWQKKQAFAADESYAIYPYEEDEPTWYNFIIEDTTETAVLADKPDYVWQGCEMYYAVVDALDEIGADSSDVQIAYHTPNFVLDGYTITAANAEDGTVEVYASNGESTYTAHLNDDGKWEFSDEAAASQDTDWLNIDGATEPSYTFEVAEDDLTASYRCLITVTDEAYKEANFKALEELGNELTDEDKAGEIILSTVQFKVVSTDIATAETSKATLENVHIASGGLIAKDENTVKLSTTTVTGNYTVDGKNVSDAGGPYVVIRTSELSLVGNSAGNYYIEKEDLSGSITPLDLYVHSIYLEDPTYPRNVKHYDGTTKATIKDILIDGVLEGDDVKIKEETLPGNYKTKDAGQKLNADGTVSSNWPYELDENPITADAHPTLTGKDAKNYRITKEKYSGAIARANLTAQVASWRGLYGDGVGEKPWHDKKAYGYGTAASAGCWLEIDGLVQGDTLTLDQSYKKSYFKTLVSGHENLVPDESTPVGTYPLTYVGLTEANYPVLKNYIVMVLNGRFVVDPRPLHVTVLDSDKIIYNENPNFHVNIQMEDDDANLIDVASDVDATPILDAKLKAKDTVSSVLYVAGGNPSNLTQEFVDAYDYRKQENVKESKTNIPFVTDCTISSLPLYADGTSTDDDFEWNYEDKTCDFCHYNHKLLAPYLVTISTDTKSGPALDVHTVVNPNGETVRNYELIIHDGGLYVHPALLKATVPLYVCMYGNTTSGEVKEPTNYRITNYSTVAIQIKNIKANGPWLMRDMPGMEYYPDGEYGNSVYDMTKNRLRRGELYMRLRDTVLTQGDNAIDHSDTAWVIPKATGDFINNNITGRAMQVPMAVYIATGNVNESGVCTPVTKVTYTIAPYGGVMPNDADFEKVQSQPWLKDAK